MVSTYFRNVAEVPVLKAGLEYQGRRIDATTDNAIAAMNLSVSLKRDLPDLAEALEEVMSRLNEAVTLDDLMRARHDLLAAYHEGERK